jgi:hypothetical protein
MGLYIFQHPKTGKTKEIIQGMNEEHSYSEGGTRWERVWTVPQAAIDANIDPFSESAFVDKVGKEKGNMGNIFDRSSEMSAKRAEKRGGVDKVKEAYYDAYSKRRGNKKHPGQIKEQISKMKFDV